MSQEANTYTQKSKNAFNKAVGHAWGAAVSLGLVAFMATKTIDPAVANLSHKLYMVSAGAFVFSAGYYAKNCAREIFAGLMNLKAADPAEVRAELAKEEQAKTATPKPQTLTTN